jgi:hypothetical protein
MERDGRAVRADYDAIESSFRFDQTRQGKRPGRSEDIGRIISARKRSGVKEQCMKKRVSKWLSSAPRAEIDDLAALPGDEIDTDDIPQVRNRSSAQRGLFFRPVKETAHAPSGR